MCSPDEEQFKKRIEEFHLTKMFPALESIKQELETREIIAEVSVDDQVEINWRAEDQALISFRLILIPIKATQRVRLESKYEIGGSTLPRQAIKGDSDIGDIEIIDIENHFFNKSVPPIYFRKD